MRTKDSSSIPLSTSLGNFDEHGLSKRNRPVNKRVFYLSIQVVCNAIIIGVVAKGLVYLIDFITNVCFYGRFSFENASPAGNQLGVAVIAIPIIGAIAVGIM